MKKGSLPKREEKKNTTLTRIDFQNTLFIGQIFKFDQEKTFHGMMINSPIEIIFKARTKCLYNFLLSVKEIIGYSKKFQEYILYNYTK